MEGKISQLAEKLLNEGVEKGEHEKDKIIHAAEKKADTIISDAEKKADDILSSAKKEAREMIVNAESEIKLAGDQSVSRLKQEITDLISSDTIDSSAEKALSDPDVMAEYIKSALKNWSGEESSLEVLLPAKMKTDLDKKLISAIGKELKKEISISKSSSITGGFQILSKDGGYKITFSDEDFSYFFGEYLRPKIRTILFGE
ncbi:MAG: hypothetical protein ACQEQ4_02580 [Fibrobacterota bacterium]